MKTYVVVESSIKYDEHKWPLFGDLKVIDLVSGLQGGFVTLCSVFFVCEIAEL